MLILLGIEVLWNQHLRDAFASVDLKGVARRDFAELMEVLLINELERDLSW